MPFRSSHAALVLALSVAAPAQAPAQDAEAADDPLAGFERLIGTWAAGNTTQRFEWGVGGLVVRARSTVDEGDGPRLVSEGVFLYDPLRDEVRGYFAAIDMPVTYFEYSARWEADTLVARLTVPTEGGDPRRYLERWEFPGSDRFLWSLRDDDGTAAPAIMSAEFRRVEDAQNGGPAAGSPARGEGADTTSTGESRGPPGGRRR